MHVRVLSLVLNKHSIVFVFNLILTLLSPCDSKDLFSLGSNFNKSGRNTDLASHLLCYIICSYFSASLGLKMSGSLGLKI